MFFCAKHAILNVRQVAAGRYLKCNDKYILNNNKPNQNSI